MTECVQYIASESSLAPSTTTTSLLEADPLASHIASGSHHSSRRTSLGLIDAARSKLAKDFSSLVRSASKRSKAGRSRSSVSLQRQVPESDDQRLPEQDYASYPTPSPLETDFNQMETMPDERHGRGFGRRLVEFLNRSRSRSQSKKRRSPSLDHPYDVPMPLPNASSSHHARHASLDDENETSTSSSVSRPSMKLRSRPLSAATTVTDTTIKPRRKYPPEQIPVSQPSERRNQPPAEVVPLQATTSNSSRKKKKGFFGVTIPSSRKGSFNESVKAASRPTSPATKLFSGMRSGSATSTERRSHESASRDLRSNVNTSVKIAQVTLVEPQPRSHPVHFLNAPPHRRGDYTQHRDRAESEVGGRCSPLCGLQTPKVGTEKGKEKEKMRGAKDWEREREVDEGRRRDEKDRERITSPRRVGSPVLNPRERESRSVMGAVIMEKVASGSGSGTSRRSSTKESGTNPSLNAARVRRIKHGSFDFERPVPIGAGGGGVTIRAALRDMGVGSETPRSSSAHPMGRSASLPKTDPARAQETSHFRGQSQPLSNSAPNSMSKAQAKPRLDVNTTLDRRGTGSSHGTSTRPTPASHEHHHHSDADPSSPISSHSGHSSSWGRSAGKHIKRVTHGAFKFEPAVPPIPGSPATDERKPSAARLSSHIGIPSKLRPDSHKPKGRSMDLGLGLSWAPTKLKEEAMLSYNSGRPGNGSAGRGKARWRGGWVEEDGRLAAGSSPAASDVAKAFKDALGDAAYSTFKTYVHRFDAHAIPLDGPYGLISHASRLLDSAIGLDERSKQALLDRFVRFVRENQ